MRHDLEEVVPSGSIDVLAIGTSPWLRRKAAALEEIEVRSEPVGEIDGFDCVLVDDPEALEAIETELPVVLVTELDGTTDVDDVLRNGVDEVVTRSEAEHGDLLCHRLRRTVERTSARRELDERESWYRTLNERSSTILLVLGEDRTREYVSPSIERISGYEPEDLTGTRFEELIVHE